MRWVIGSIPRRGSAELLFIYLFIFTYFLLAVVRAFAHGAIGRLINPSWGGPTELFLVPASAPRLAVVCTVLCV